MGAPDLYSICLGDKLLITNNSACLLNLLIPFKLRTLDRSHLMPQPNEMTPLGLKILDHWKLHRPKMVEALKRENRLLEAVFAAQELTTDLLHELTVAKKMDYQMAWEIATREWAFLPDEDDQPQLSFDPATLSPPQHSPETSE